MINYFPSVYPDELLYSWLSRYYVKSAYTSYIFCAEEIYLKPTSKPNIEFANKLTPAAIKAITRVVSLEDVIMKHTMYPLYARFLPQERREYAFKVLVNTQTSDANLLPVPKTKDGNSRYLKYCPICTRNDRDTYGESYFHRMHQLIGINVCPVHGCRMKNSKIAITSKASPSLISAEEVIPSKEEYITYGTELEFEIAKYMANVFEKDIDIYSDVKIGAFLHSKMANTKYVSLRGQQRKMTLFHKEFMEYYKELSGNWFTEEWQIQKVLNEYRWNMYEICLMAIFLGIPAEELVNMKLPEKSRQQLFDERVCELHSQGLNYRQIANKLNASYDLVKPIGEGRYGKFHYASANPQKCGSKKKEWERIDNERLPIVKEAIKKLQGNGDTRPKRVNQCSVVNIMGLSKKALENCPKCMAEVQKHCESQEQYWAKEVVWAVEKLARDEKVLNWTNISKITNMRKQDLVRCLPYLKQYADSDIEEKIQFII